MSDITPAFIGVVDDAGKVRIDYPAQFHAYARRFIGDEIEIEIRKRRTKRSDKQNSTWWGLVVPILAAHCGYTADEMHEALKVKFLGQEDMSKGLLRVKSTTKLNTQEFADLVERVVLWAAEDLGVVIPQPDPKWREKKSKKAA